MPKRKYSTAFPNQVYILYTGIGAIKDHHSILEFVIIMRNNFPETEGMTLNRLIEFSGARYMFM